MPVDLYGKTVLIIGFGNIGTRSAKRFAAMETQRPGLRPVYVFGDDPRHGLRAGAGPRRRGGACRFHHDPLPENPPRRPASSTPRGSRI
jgi:hypothetical protein